MPLQTHRLWAEYTGRLDADLDERMSSAVGRECDGSGYWFSEGGVRDMEWIFDVASHADLAASNLRAVGDTRIITVEIEPLEDNE